MRPGAAELGHGGRSSAPCRAVPVPAPGVASRERRCLASAVRRGRVRSPIRFAALAGLVSILPL